MKRKYLASIKPGISIRIVWVDDEETDKCVRIDGHPFAKRLAKKAYLDSFHEAKRFLIGKAWDDVDDCIYKLHLARETLDKIRNITDE